MTLRTLPLLASLFALPLRGEDFSLERHIPADFHYRYLSVSPRLDWDVTDVERMGPSSRSENEWERSGLGLALRHGSERSTRRLQWSLGNGLDFEREDSRFGGRDKFSGPDGDRAETLSDQEGGSWRYGLHAHPSIRWFLPRRLFLSASAKSHFRHAPALPVSGTRWQSTRPAEGPADSVLLVHTRSESSRKSVSAGLQARVGAGIGRIERVGFAAGILHLLDRITEVTGRPVRLSREEMRDLEARVEARRKQRPFLEGRRASLHDLETVEMFLRERGTGPAGAAGPLPPRALLAMADEWQHPAPGRRESGFEVKVQPFLLWSWFEQDGRDVQRQISRILPADSLPDPGRPPPGGPEAGVSSVREIRNGDFSGERTLGVGLEAAWRRPWRRRFQFDADAYARACTRSLERGMSRFSGNPAYGDPVRTGAFLAYGHPRAEGYWDAGVSFYPDSRSRVTGGAGGYGERSFDYTGSKASLAALLGREPVLSSWRLHHQLRAEAEYRPGYRLSFTVTAAAGLDWSSATDEPPGWLGTVPDPEGWSRSRLDRTFLLRADLAYYVF